MKRWLLTSLVVVFAFVAGVAYAQKRHPNLNAAQTMIRNAAEKLTAAQEAHEYDLGGHAAKAKEALGTAEKEIKLAIDSIK